jgi:nucleoside-diphosphate-sugar epimerase
MPFTSIRPTYIYGPQNYNPLEEYFFDRVANDRPVAIPGRPKPHGSVLLREYIPGS